MAFYDPMKVEVRVLLVDNDVNRLHETYRLLELSLYKVTASHNIAAASSMMSNGKTTFDLLMIDITSSNLEGYKLLHEAIDMGLIVILMSTHANATLAKCAIEDGAFLFMEKPNNVYELKYLWQHVLREKSRKSRENSKLSEGVTVNQCVLEKDEPSLKGNSEHLKCINSEDSFSDPFMRSKFCTEWTPELHENFLAAVRHLGEGRCFPKDILELMNVPGLTRMQVASHLQKWRYGWKLQEERQGHRLKPSKSSKKSDSHPSNSKCYGLFPRLIKGFQPNEHGPTRTSINNQTWTPSNNICNINMGGQGTLNANIVLNNNMNGISNGDLVGNMTMATQNRGPQLDTTFDFCTSDDVQFANNFGLQDLDYGHIISDGKTSDVDDHNKESEFWTSWIADFARDGN